MLSAARPADIEGKTLWALFTQDWTVLTGRRQHHTRGVHQTCLESWRKHSKASWVEAFHFGQEFSCREVFSAMADR